MITLSANDVQLYDRMCQKILDLDKKIRFAGIISQMGKLVAGGQREGVKLLVSKDRHEMLFMEVVLRIRMRHEFDLDLGPVNFTISHRDKVVVMSIPYKDKILYVSAENDIDLSKTSQAILEIIRRPEYL